LCFALSFCLAQDKPTERVDIGPNPLTEAKVSFVKAQIVDGKVAGLYLPTDAQKDDYMKPIVTVSATYGTDNVVTNSRFEIPYKTLAKALQDAPAGAVIVVIDQDEVQAKNQAVSVTKDHVSLYATKTMQVKDIVISGKNVHISGVEKAVAVEVDVGVEVDK